MDIIIRYPPGYTKGLLDRDNRRDRGLPFQNRLYKNNKTYPTLFQTQYVQTERGNCFKYQEDQEAPRVYHLEGDTVIGFSKPEANALVERGGMLITRPVKSFEWVNEISLPDLYYLKKFYAWVGASDHFKREEVKIMEKKDNG